MTILMRAAFAAAALALAVSSAHAASVIAGKKLEVEVDQAKIDEEKAALWERFGGWCAVSEWHPAIAKCEESEADGKTYRTLTLEDGGVIKELLLDKSKFGYKYEILESPLPVQNYTAQFSIVPDDDDLDEVNFTWSATFDPKDATGKEARKTIDGIFEAGLDSIEKMIEDGEKKG